MKTWIMELCPEIQEWQAEIIAEYTQKLVESEREACAKVCEDDVRTWSYPGSITRVECAAAIRARSNT